jgi:hypothetical protein
MDQRRFDPLAKIVGSWTSRRNALLLLAGVGLGDNFPVETEAASSGKCNPTCSECQGCNKGKCKKKHGKKRCKKGTCEPLTNGTPCTSLSGGACCNGTCLDTQSDESNCGGCGTVCGTNQVCQGGTCFPKAACPVGQTGICTPISALCRTDCACSRSTEGNVVCVNLAGAGCLTTPPCSTSADCAPGLACVDVTQVGGPGGCGCASPTKLCFPACPMPSPASEAGAARDHISGGLLGP